MSKDYYTILGLDRSASEIDIKKAYRTLALKWHPQVNDSNIIDTTKQFEQLSEAYAVLSNNDTRAVFDVHGEEGLKTGVPDGKGGFFGGWRNRKTGEEIFTAFFGTTGPFQATHVQSLFVNTSERSLAPKPPPIKKILYLTLEEIYGGKTLYLKVNRRRLNNSRTSTRDQETTLKVVVKPGTPSGTLFTFENHGHQEPGSSRSGDVIFEIRDAPHPYFRRENDTLVYTHKIFVSDALAGTSVPMRTLDDRVVNIAVTEVVFPGFTKLFVGQGMPLLQGGKGDLRIDFKLEFPEKVSLETGQRLKTLLPAH